MHNRFITISAIHLILIELVFVNIEAQSRNPQLLYHSAYGSANAVALYSNWLYIGSGTSLRIFDVSDNHNEIEKGHIHFNGKVHELEINWPILSVAVEQVGIKLINVSDPDSPAVISHIDNFNAVGRIIAGNDSLLFIAALEEGTFIYSLSDPYLPKQLAHIPTIGEETKAVDVVNPDKNLIIAESEDGWRVFDISEPSKPKFISQTKKEQKTVGVAVNDNNLFVAYQRAIRGTISVYENGSFISPTLLADIEVNSFIALLRMAAQPDLLVGAYSGVGFLLVDVSNPDNPQQATYYDYSAGNDLELNGNTVYLVDQWSRGIEIIQVDNIFHPLPIDTIFTGASVSCVKSYQERKFVSGRNYNGLVSELVTEKNDGELVTKSSLPIPGQAISISPSGNLLYVMPDGYLLDISNQEKISLLSRTPLDHLYGVGQRKYTSWINDTLLISSVDGQHLNDKGGIELVSVGDPLKPHFLDFYETSSFNNYSLLARDSLVYCVIDKFFLIFSVSSEKELKLLSEISMPYLGFPLALFGKYAYIWDVGDSLVSINCENPAQPFIENKYKFNFKALQFLIHDNNLFILDRSNRVHIFPLTVPSEPRLAQSFSFPNQVLWIDITSDNKLLTANGEDGASIWTLPQITSINETDIEPSPQQLTFILNPVNPNPGNNQFQLSYSLLSPAEIRMSIFNILGEKVKTFIRGVQPSGEYSITWDGTNDLNRRVPSGIYFAQLSTTNKVSIQKFVLVQ